MLWVRVGGGGEMGSWQGRIDGGRGVECMSFFLQYEPLKRCKKK